MTLCSVQNVNAAILLENSNSRKFYAVSKFFMVRSAKAIDRLLIILPLARFLFAVLSGFLSPLGQVIRRFRTLLCTF